MQNSKTRVTDNSVSLTQLKQNAKILRRICINKKFRDLSKQTKVVQDELKDLELKPSDDILADLRKSLFDIAFDMDKRLERNSSRTDDNFSFSVMFA